MPRKGTGLQLSVNEEDKELLTRLAIQQGFVRGTKPNITGLIEAIACGQIVLTTEGKALTHNEQETLVAAVLALLQQAAFKAARSMGAIIKSNFTLEPLYLQQIDRALSEISLPWILKLEECIEKKQTFQLSYQDAAGQIWTKEVHYAEIVFHDSRYYLECWCEQIEGNKDIPELQHNWSLRLDRIADAGVVPCIGKWRGSLDTVEVEFELYHGLAHAYKTRDGDDVAVEWLSAFPPIKQVRRNITSSFWFIRSILPYGQDCRVRSPSIIQEKVKLTLEAAYQQYL